MKMELFADVVPKTAENMRWASYKHISFYHQKNSIHVDKLVVFDEQNKYWGAHCDVLQ